MIFTYMQILQKGLRLVVIKVILICDGGEADLNSGVNYN